MSTFTHTGACAPRALSRLFKEPFETSCRRIIAAGGDYQSVTPGVMQKLLVDGPGVKQAQFLKQPRLFQRWRRGKRGAWVTVVTAPGSNGHCVTLRNGEAMDNGWVTWQRGRLERVRVHCAWQLTSLKTSV